MHVIMTLFVVFLPLFAVFFGGFSSSRMNTKAPRNLDQKWKKKKMARERKDQIITQGDSQALFR